MSSPTLSNTNHSQTTDSSGQQQKRTLGISTQEEGTCSMCKYYFNMEDGNCHCDQMIICCNAAFRQCPIHRGHVRNDTPINWILYRNPQDGSIQWQSMSALSPL